ncbi:mitochondrial peripheral inner membrane protein [Pseudogymnoascus australis]
MQGPRVVAHWEFWAEPRPSRHPMQRRRVDLNSTSPIRKAPMHRCAQLARSTRRVYSRDVLDAARPHIHPLHHHLQNPHLPHLHNLHPLPSPLLTRRLPLRPIRPSLANPLVPNLQATPTPSRPLLHPPPPSDPTTSPSTPGALRFLIRREHGGEVSSYLSALPVGATIDVRGPVVEYKVPGDVSEVVFLAGGTGIAPALQAVRAVLGEGEGDTDKKVKILWANRNRSECAGAPVSSSWWGRIWGTAPGQSEPPSPLVEELRGLEARYGGRVEVKYFIDAEGTFIDRRGILEAVKSAKGEEKEGKKLIMVAGPEGFVKHYVGARVWEGGEEKQGPLGGVVKGLGLGVGGCEVIGVLDADDVRL